MRKKGETKKVQRRKAIQQVKGQSLNTHEITRMANPLLPHSYKMSPSECGQLLRTGG